MANQALDMLIAANIKRKEANSDVTGSLDSLNKSLQNFQAQKQQQRQNQINGLLAEAKLKNAQTQERNTELQSTLLNKFLGQEAGDGSNFPPGTTLKAGPLTIPLNSKLTDAQTSAVAGFDKFDALVKTIESNIDKGVLDKGVSRTYNQVLAEGGGDPVRRFLTPDDSKLEELASAAAEMKKFAFSEGGKQLSPTELKVVMAGLSFVGKGNKQIKKDFSAAIDILRQKKKLALGGTAAASNSNKSSLKSSTLRKDAQSAIANGANPAAVSERFKQLTGEEL